MKLFTVNIFSCLLFVFTVLMTQGSWAMHKFWTEEELALLPKLVKKHHTGKRNAVYWHDVSASFKALNIDRTPNACRLMFSKLKKNDNGIKIVRWTKRENTLLIKSVSQTLKEHNGKINWDKVIRMLERSGFKRSKSACMTQYSRLKNRNKSKKNQKKREIPTNQDLLDDTTRKINCAIKRAKKEYNEQQEESSSDESPQNSDFLKSLLERNYPTQECERQENELISEEILIAITEQIEINSSTEDNEEQKKAAADEEFMESLSKQLAAECAQPFDDNNSLVVD